MPVTKNFSKLLNHYWFNAHPIFQYRANKVLGRSLPAVLVPAKAVTAAAWSFAHQ